jgi:redox-sensitive bicupin YhaK (pirin superfamily)
MRAVAGQVVDGRVVVPGTALTNGESVLVILNDETEPALTEQDASELLLAQASVRRGEFVTADELLAHLRSKRT